MRTVAIIPAFNEEAQIASVVLLARPHVDEVLVVDDGSTDRTAELARAAGASVVHLPGNLGKGRALREGFAKALLQGVDVVLTLDADGQHDPASIPSLLEPIRADRADLVIGSRRITAEQRKGIPRHRRAGQFVFSLATRTASDARIKDSESGFRAYRATLLGQLRLSENGFGTEWEALRAASASGARILEVPIVVSYAGTSHHQNAVVHGWAVGSAILRFVRSEHPLLFFGLPGFALFLVGLFLGFETATHYFGTGEFWPGKAMMAMLATLLGAVGIACGLILDAVSTMLRRYGRAG